MLGADPEQGLGDRDACQPAHPATFRAKCEIQDAEGLYPSQLLFQPIWQQTERRWYLSESRWRRGNLPTQR